MYATRVLVTPSAAYQVTIKTNKSQDSIRRLQKLRTLHVQCPVVSDMFGSWTRRGGYARNDSQTLATQMQTFANLVYGEFFKNPDFNLEVLIIGHLRPMLRGSMALPAGEEGDLDPGCRYLPQFCFIRSRQEDWLGRTATTGVPVSRSLLRRTHPHVNVLDVDRVEAFEQWVGQAI